MALQKINALQDALSDFQPWHATRAAILAKLGHTAQAAEAYTQAIDMAPDPSSRLFLQNRLNLLKPAAH